MTRNKVFHLGLSGSASVLGMALALAPLSAHAQAAPAPAPAQEATMIQEVIVTASKRSQSVQDIVGSVTGISAETLKVQGIHTIDDVTQHTPAMTFYTMSGSTFITLRGVGVPVDTGASDPNTAINVDGVNLPRSQEATLSAYDTERMEVARGPQGTLYGRNAIGGAINIISMKPSHDFRAEIGAGYGNYDSYVLHGYMTGPISDKVRVLVSASASGHDEGYVKNLYNGKTFDRDHAWSVRAAVQADLTETLRLDVSVQMQHEKYDSFQQLMGGTIVVPGCAGVAACAGGGGLWTIPNLKYSLNPYEMYSAYSEPSRKTTQMANATLTWDITPRIHLKSITGATRFTNNKSLDGLAVVPTGEVLPIKDDGDPFYFSQPSNYYSQEFNLSGEFGHGGSWVVGAFVSDERYRVDIPIYLVAFGTTYDNPNPDNPIYGTDFGINFNAHYHEQTQAVFGDVTIPITNRLRVFGGVRVAKEANDAYYSTAVMIYPTGFARPVPANAVLVADGCGFLTGGAVSDVTQYKFSWSPTTPRAGVQYDITDHVKAYVQWSKGFKDGGTAATLCGNTYAPEYMTSYEGGIKSTLMNGRLVLNMALYHYDYTGMQIYQGIGTASAQVVNADATITGFDAELQALITDTVSVDVAANYLDDKFKNFASVDASDPTNSRGLPTVLVNGVPTPNLDGNRLPGVPDYNVTVGLQDNIPLEMGMFNNLLMRIEGNFVGKLDIAEWQRPETMQGAFMKLNAVVQLAGGNGWKVRLYGRNLTDKATSYHFLWNGGANVWSGQYAPPRTFGIEVTKTFGG